MKFIIELYIILIITFFCNSSFSAEPVNATLYFDSGNEHYNSEEYDKAIEDYDRVISAYPDFTKAYLNRGLAYYKTGQYDKAVADYSKVIAA